MKVFGLWLVGSAVWLVGCESEKPGVDTGEGERVEGDVEGDCSDGLDNDGDAFFDCLDVGCEDAPECLEDEADDSTSDYPNTETEPSGEVPQIDSVGWGCDADAYWFDVYTTGVSIGGWLYMYQTGVSTPWDENHPMSVYETASDGSWTRNYLSLDSIFPDVSAVISGSTTLYDCTDSTNMQDTLTFIIEIDSTAELAVECVVWGDNPDGVPADDCARIIADTVKQLR